ncbi:hypothetical protein SODALDRAFT_77534 [Sodiomyces alkalinus F11]|uniref:Uncharacterized protein n=1 Tax=Sodiomyces alkalinus (strain CBS 110278 / VKM F-3762 / F11) TaxID=1314773 RepID=A0A3N2PKR6_SODAK|nr:hypothetical protein SODALDRAFT_77534 [Sodiomyces alkalinus F11]ROT35089.1 hypothetical protein SODALDRAFT_77534 [Sodiomyces alkalinus F11]
MCFLPCAFTAIILLSRMLYHHDWILQVTSLPGPPDFPDLSTIIPRCSRLSPVGKYDQSPDYASSSTWYAFRTLKFVSSSSKIGICPASNRVEHPACSLLFKDCRYLPQEQGAGMMVHMAALSETHEYIKVT